MNKQIFMDATQVNERNNLLLTPAELKLQKISKKELLGSGDVMIVLQICPRTLYRWRKNGLLKFSRIANKFYYFWADILTLLDNASPKK